MQAWTPRTQHGQPSRTHTPLSHDAGRAWFYDANGLEWKYLRWINTETGEAEQLVTIDGRYQLDDNDELLTQKVRLAPPILLVPFDE